VGGWRPTAALVRAAGVGGALLLVAVLLRRADLVVIAAPLLLGAGIALAGRPHAGPSLALAVPRDALLEGGRAALVATVRCADAIDVAAVVLPPARGLQVEGGASAARAVLVAAGTDAVVTLPVRTVRWGRHPVGPAVLRATAAHGLLSWPPVSTAVATVTTWPLRDGFTAPGTVPRAEGLVGGHRSRLPGEGGDLAGVRPFVVGDRLRRVNWRVTGRTGTLHVTSTYSDRDTEVLLILDGTQDLGRPPANSLDTGVRAAAAIAEHYLRAGDRVALVDLARPYRSVPARNGRGHLVRLLDVLVDARLVRSDAGTGPSAADVVGLAAADALVVLLSPLATASSLDAVAALARSGRSVVAVDTLPEGLRPDPRGDWTELAFRVWKLRREADVGRLVELGVPVVPWQGSGSLDAVLRDASRTARTAR
jgi:uncharacterized protein (DUF58 family)